jgi:hypothetical protein
VRGKTELNIIAGFLFFNIQIVWSAFFDSRSGPVRSITEDSYTSKLDTYTKVPYNIGSLPCAVVWCPSVSVSVRVLGPCLSLASLYLCSSLLAE